MRPLADDDGRVRPIARLGHAVDPLVIDDFVTEPAYDPVIGPSWPPPATASASASTSSRSGPGSGRT